MTQMYKDTIQDLIKVPNFIEIDYTTGKGTFMLVSQTFSGLAFKIKTTRPKEYIVEPSSGQMLPYQEVKVIIKLTQFCDLKEIVKKEEDAEILKDKMRFDTKHKFKIEVTKFVWNAENEKMDPLINVDTLQDYSQKLEVKIVKHIDKVKKKENKNEFVDTLCQVTISYFLIRLLVTILSH